MHSQLFRTIERDQGRDRDQAAVALGELGPLPDVAEDNLVCKIDELGNR